MRNLKALALVGGVSLLFSATGCQMFDRDSGDRSAGRVLDDKLITERIEDKLDDAPVYKFEDVDVRTFAGVVQLNGFVTSEEQRQHAQELAQSVPGVQRVVNNLTLKPRLSPTGRVESQQSGSINDRDNLNDNNTINNRDANRANQPNQIDQ